MVEHRLAKARVASSNLVFRSILFQGDIAKGLRQRTANPPSPVRIRVSPPTMVITARLPETDGLAVFIVTLIT